MRKVPFDVASFYRDLKIEVVKEGKTLNEIFLSVGKYKTYLSNKKHRKAVHIDTYNLLKEMLSKNSIDLDLDNYAL